MASQLVSSQYPVAILCLIGWLIAPISRAATTRVSVLASAVALITTATADGDVLNQFSPVEYPAVQPEHIEGAVMTSNLKVAHAPVRDIYTAVFGGRESIDLSLCNVRARMTNAVWLLKQEPPSTWHKCNSNDRVPPAR